LKGDAIVFEFLKRRDRSGGVIPVHRQTWFGTYLNSVLAMVALAIGMFINNGLWDSIRPLTAFNEDGTDSAVDLIDGIRAFSGDPRVTMWFITAGFILVWIIIFSWFIVNIRDYFALIKEIRDAARDAARRAAKETGTLVEEEIGWLTRFWNWSFGYRLKMLGQKAKKKRLERQAKMDEQLAKLEAQVKEAQDKADGKYVEPEETDVPDPLFDEEK
jgi:hypothetical protein